MSDRDELIAKARGIRMAACKTHPERSDLSCYRARTHDGQPVVELEFVDLLSTLADLAESEGRRADEAEAKLANRRGSKLFMRGYDQAREDLMRAMGYPWIDLATCGNIRETIRGLNITERLQMMMTELAALKGQVERMRPVVEAVRAFRQCAHDAYDECDHESPLYNLPLPPKEQP